MIRGLLALSLLFLVSCSDTNHYHTGSTQQYEGVYFLENGGTIEIIADSENKLHIVKRGQIVNTVNPKNNTLGTLPKLRSNDAVVEGKTLKLKTRTVNFKDGHDIEQDSNGANIRGRRAFESSITFLEDGKLKINVKIYQGTVRGNLNFPIATREILSI